MAAHDYSRRDMTRSFALCALAAGLLTATSAVAQMYPGEGISTNPNAAIARPTGPYGPYPGIVRLHMPVHHRHVVKKPVEAAATPADTTAQPSSAVTQPAASPPLSDLPDMSASAPDQTQAAAPAPVKKKHKASVQAATPAPETAPPVDNTGQDAALPLSLAPEEQHPIAAPKPKAARSQKTASIAPTTQVVPATDTPGATSNLSKRSEILFPRGATDPGPATVNKLRGVASELNTLLGAGAQRVQLDAYGGAPGDKSSDARRISLKRALVIRQILIEDGVPSERIDVRALGGIDDSGAPDRVDVYVSAS